jgi:hypothetical protein
VSNKLVGSSWVVEGKEVGVIPVAREPQRGGDVEVVAAAEAVWRHEGATAPPVPSHASSRAGRPPATAFEGGRTGGITGVPEHGGKGTETLAAGGARHGRQSGWRPNRGGGGVDQGALVSL